MENLIGLADGFLVVCFLYKINSNPRKTICCGEKSGPNATFNLNLFFLGLGWLALFIGFDEKFVGSIIIVTWYMFSNLT